MKSQSCQGATSQSGHFIFTSGSFWCRSTSGHLLHSGIIATHRIHRDLAKTSMQHPLCLLWWRQCRGSRCLEH